MLNAKAGFFCSENCVSIFFFFSRGEVASFASSFDSGSKREVSSSSSDSREGSFIFFLELLLCEDSLELVVLVSESFSVFFAFATAGVAAGVATSILILATSAITSLIGRCLRGVFSSSTCFSFYGIVKERGGQLGPTCDPETSFRMSTRVASILHPKFIE